MLKMPGCSAEMIYRVPQWCVCRYGGEQPGRLFIKIFINPYENGIFSVII